MRRFGLALSVTMVAISALMIGVLALYHFSPKVASADATCPAEHIPQQLFDHAPAAAIQQVVIVVKTIIPQCSP